MILRLSGLNLFIDVGKTIKIINMKAIGSKIIVKTKSGDEVLTEKIGDFTVPAGAGQYEIADVVSVGSDIKDLSVGDEVLIYPKAGYAWSRDGKDFRTISIADVVAVC